MKQRREDIRNIALIVGSGCLGALAVGIGLTAATSVDVKESDRFQVTEIRVEGKAAPPGEPVVTRHRTVSGYIVGKSETVAGGEGAEATVQSIVVTGVARSDPSVRLRASRPGEGEPVVYIDGVRADGGLDALVPEEIANIEILKEGAAVERYGEEGRNGVVVVTTKSGRKRPGGGNR